MDQSSIILWALGYAFISGAMLVLMLRLKRWVGVACYITGGYFGATAIIIMMELFP